jgi:hypothetical protein
LVHSFEVLSNLMSQTQLIEAFRLRAAVTHGVLHDGIGSRALGDVFPSDRELAR